MIFSKRNKLAAVIFAMSGLVAELAVAEEQTVFAKVVNRTPIMESIQKTIPKRVCYQEEVVTQNTKSYTPSILGGVIGAAAGNQVGHGKGKDLATVAGAVLGASVGRDVQNKAAQQHRATVERCHDEHEYIYEERISGWRVTYEYNGATYITRTDRDPGDSIRLNIAIRPDV